jgi:hypothetical protein
MARMIKRLLDRWDSREIDQLIQLESDDKWRGELAWWRRAGVDTGMLLNVLEKIRVKRMRYEEQLQERETRERPRNIREVRKAFKAAAPLIRFLKTKKALGDDGSPELFFGDLGEQVERAVQSYIDDSPGIVPRGRPGDLWLVQCVVVLATQLMSGPFPEHRSGRRIRPPRWVRQSERNTIRAIERVLKLAGHGEVVTEEKIRHIIRSIRPLIRKCRQENDGSLPIGPAAYRSHRTPDFTQELPRKLLPKRAKAGRSHVREKR